MEVFSQDRGPDGPWQVRVVHEWHDGAHKLYAWKETRDGKRFYAEGFCFAEPAPDGTQRTPPRPLAIDHCEDRQDNVRSFLQGVLDAAWELGLRPVGYKDVESEAKATRYHLEDMRRLVFKDPVPKVHLKERT